MEITCLLQLGELIIQNEYPDVVIIRWLDFFRLKQYASAQGSDSKGEFFWINNTMVRPAKPSREISKVIDLSE